MENAQPIFASPPWQTRILFSNEISYSLPSFVYSYVEENSEKYVLTSQRTHKRKKKAEIWINTTTESEKSRKKTNGLENNMKFLSLLDSGGFLFSC